MECIMDLQLSKKRFYWLDLIWFQLVWFIAIFYTDKATLILLTSLCMHFLLSPTRLSDLYNLIQITVIGVLADYLLAYLGILIFTGHAFIPLWLILLWGHFAVTLNHGMSWLIKIPLIARILFGGIFGTLSYYSGSQLDSVILHSNLFISLFALCVIWSVLLPVYISLASLNRMRCDENIKGNFR